MSNHSWVKRLCALAVGSSLLLACGGSNDEEVATTTTSSSSVAPATTTEAPEPGPSEDVIERAEVIRMGVTTLVQTFDPAMTLQAHIHYLTPLYDSVLLFDEEGVPGPGIGSDFEYDGVTATFTVQDGLTFADGSPIDAEVVAVNLRRFVEKAGPLSTSMRGMSSVDVEGSTVTMTFDVPNHSLANDLAGPAGMIMNPEEFDAVTLDTDGLGASGPYTLDLSSTVSGDRYVYVRNENYWNPARQHADRIEIVAVPDPAARINALRAGELDVVVVPPNDAQSLESAGFELSSTRSWLNFGIVFDRSGSVVPALADVRVRQAMSMAIDRDLLAQSIFFGYAEGTVQPFFEGEAGYTDAIDLSVVGYDADRARALLAEAGYPDGFSLTIPAIPSTRPATEAVAGFWSEIGIDVSIENLQPGTLGAAWREGTYPVGIAPTPVAEPGSFYDTYYSTQGPFVELFGLDERALREILDAARAEGNPDVREGLLAVATKLIVEQGMLIVLTRSDQLSASTNGVTGMKWQYNTNAPDPTLLRVG